MILPHSAETEHLIRAGQKGDTSAIDTLIRIYAADIHRVIYSIMGNSSRVEDLAQETFIRVFTRLDQYKFQASFRAWIIKIAVNLCRDEFRRKKINRIFSPLLAEREEKLKTEHAHFQPDREYEQHETRQRIDSALQKLQKPLRLVFTLREIHGLSYEEISQILHWRPGTVKSRLFRARKDLAELLSDRLEEV